MKKTILNKDINLIPSYIEKNKKQRDVYSMFLMLLVLVFLGCVLLFFSFLGKTFNSDKKFEDNKSKIAEYQETKKKQEELAALREELQKYVEFERNINSSNSNMMKIIDILDNYTTPFTLTGLADSVSGSTKIITITGTCDTAQDVADLLNYIDNTDICQKVKVLWIKQSGTTEEPTEDFSIECIFAAETDSSTESK